MTADAFSPARLGPITLRNRVIKAATFEGRTPKRVVTPELIEFHRRFAAGGVGMTTVAYCAVTRAGTTDGHQIVLDDPEVGTGLRALTDAVHAEGAAIAAQIGHAGPVANPMGTKSPSVAPSRVFSPLGMRRTQALTADDIATHHAPVRRRRRGAARRRLRRDRGPHRSRLPAQRVPLAAAQPAHRRVGRQPREPRPLPARRRARGARGGRAATSRSPRRST